MIRVPFVRKRSWISLNIWFIMVWNVLGEFVSPKNITHGSKRPYLVLNAAFSSSPDLIRMLLYPQRTSNLVKICVLDLTDNIGDKWEGITVLNGIFIEFSVILYRLEFTVFLFHKEEW